MAAIRECFEESGILLARRRGGDGIVLLDNQERDTARKAIHSGKIRFQDWLLKVGGVPDTGELFSVMMVTMYARY